MSQITIKIYMKNRLLSAIKKKQLSIVSALVLFVFWEAVSKFNIISPLFISSPSSIFSAGFEMVRTGEIFPHLFLSLEALFLGLTSAVIFGLIAGLAISSNKVLYNIFLPHVFILNSLPMVAIIPLVIIWLGIGMYAKISIVFLVSLKPILMSTIDGAANVDIRLINMAKSFGASQLFVLNTITRFSILPFLFSALRMAAGRSITGLIVGEAFGYGKGLGFLVSFYGATFQTSRLMFVILILIAISLTITRLIIFIENKLIIWKR